MDLSLTGGGSSEPREPPLAYGLENGYLIEQLDQQVQAVSRSDRHIKHLEEMSAMENRKLLREVKNLTEQLKKLEEKSQMDTRKQNEKIAKLESQLQNIVPQQEGITFDPVLRWPPFDLSCPARFYQQRRFWASEPFLVCNGRFKVLLRLCVSMVNHQSNVLRMILWF